MRDFHLLLFASSLVDVVVAHYVFLCVDAAQKSKIYFPHFQNGIKTKTENSPKLILLYHTAQTYNLNTIHILRYTLK